MLSASLPVWTVVFYPHICWAICFLPVFVLYAVIVIHVDLQINAFIRTPIHHAWLSRDASVILTWIQMKKKEQNVSITNWSMTYLLSRILIIKLTRSIQRFSWPLGKGASPFFIGKVSKIQIPFFVFMSIQNCCSLLRCMGLDILGTRPLGS